MNLYSTDTEKEKPLQYAAKLQTEKIKQRTGRIKSRSSETVVDKEKKILREFTPYIIATTCTKARCKTIIQS